jgi:hypothetical protein
VGITNSTGAEQTKRKGDIVVLQCECCPLQTSGESLANKGADFQALLGGGFGNGDVYLKVSIIVTIPAYLGIEN